MKLIEDRAKSVDLETFLAKPLFAHIATNSDKGSRDSPVWFYWDGNAVWIIGDSETDTFPKRIQKDSRCAVGIVDYARNTGKVEHVGMRGHATVQSFDPDIARALLRRYLGQNEKQWDRRFLLALEAPTSLLVRFVPETVVARDVSYQAATVLD